jgi:hypothetical protein
MEEKLQLTDQQFARLREIGMEMQFRLKHQFDQWGTGLPFVSIISNKYHDAKRMGITVTKLAQILEEQGFIKVINTITGSRFVFSGDCDLTPNEMLSSILEQQIHKQVLKGKINERK